MGLEKMRAAERYGSLSWFFFNHLLLFVLLGAVCDGGLISIPGQIYCLIICPYVIGRFIVNRIKNKTWPKFKPVQQTGLNLLPVWGLPIFVIMFHLGQSLK